MKKNFFKKLAFVLAAAMVIPSAIPAASGSAAAAPNFAKRQTNVYDGKSYSYTVKNVPKGGSVKWSVTGAGKSYVKLSKTTGKTVKVTVKTSGKTAAKNAAAKVQAKVYNKSKKLVKTVGDAVKVKISATAVNIGVQEGIDMKALPANTAVKFSRKITPANATSTTYWTVTTKDGKETTGASISAKGEFKAAETGDYKITAEAKNSKTGVTKASKTVDVTVGASLKSAAVTGTKAITVTLVGTDSKLTKDSFKVTRTDNNTSVTIDSITNNGSAVVLNLATTMINEKTYKVEMGSASAEVTAKYGVPAKIEIKDQTVPPAAYTKVDFTVYDENGIDISTEYTYENFDYITDATIVDGKIYLGKVGDTAKIKVRYTGTTPVESVEVTVTAAENALGSIKAYTVANSKSQTDLGETVDYAKPKNWISLSDTNGYKLYVQFVDNNGKIVDESRDYQANQNENKYEYDLVSGSESILEIDKEGYIIPYKVGTAQIKVTCGKLVDYVTIEVKEERKLKSMTISDNLTLSRAVIGADGSVAPEAGTITLKLLDQYEEEWKVPNTTEFKVEHISGDYAATFTGLGSQAFTTTNKYFTGNVLADNSSAEIALGAAATNDSTTKTERVKVTCGSFYKYLTITTKQPQTDITNIKISSDDVSDISDGTFNVYGYDRAGIKKSVIVPNNNCASATGGAGAGLVAEISYEVRDTYGDLLASRTYEVATDGVVSIPASAGQVSAVDSVTAATDTGAKVTFTSAKRTVSGEDLMMPEGNGNIKVILKLYTDTTKKRTKTLTTSGTYKVSAPDDTVVPQITLKTTTIDGTVFSSVAEAFNGNSVQEGIANINLNPKSVWLADYEVIGFIKSHKGDRFYKSVSNPSKGIIVADDFSGVINANSGLTGSASVNIAYVVVKDKHANYNHIIKLDQVVKVVVK